MKDQRLVQLVAHTYATDANSATSRPLQRRSGHCGVRCLRVTTIALTADPRVLGNALNL